MKKSVCHSLVFMFWVAMSIASPIILGADKVDYLSARWHPLHFKPAIETATDGQCLGCHQEVLERRPRKVSAAGVDAEAALAWYQTLDTYEGEQESFHRRHLVTPKAKRLMRFKCNSCHQGHDPRDEISGSADLMQAG